MALLVALHALAAVIWVGGMFFAYMVLRPSAGPLEPPLRLTLWRRVFGLFFPWVWASIVILLASGYGLVFLHFGGFAGVGVHVHIMQATGILMMLLFLHLFFGPWRRFGEAVDKQAFPLAAQKLNQIRQIVAVNLVLGLLTVVAGASGRFW
jgi:uncharacterized membrane protein